MVAVDADSGRPCRTVLEIARDAGLFTGLVSTSRVTHATPAAFSSHVDYRGKEAVTRAT